MKIGFLSDESPHLSESSPYISDASLHVPEASFHVTDELPNLSDASPHVLIIAGESQKGKTTALNNIFGTDFQLDPIEDDVMVKEVRKDGRSYILIDTPGFGCSSNMADKEVRKRIHEAVKGLDFTLLLCLSVNSGKISNDSTKKLLRNLQSCLHDRIWEKCVLLLTFSDDLLRNTDNIQQYKDLISNYAEAFQQLLNETFKLKQDVKTVFEYHNEYTRINSGYSGIVAVPIRKKQDVKIQQSEDFTRDLDIIPGIPFSESWSSVVFDLISTKLAPLTLTSFDFKTTVANARSIGEGADKVINVALFIVVVGAIIGTFGRGIAAALIGAVLIGAGLGGASLWAVGAIAGIGTSTTAKSAYEEWVKTRCEDQIRSLRKKIHEDQIRSLREKKRRDQISLSEKEHEDQIRSLREKKSENQVRSLREMERKGQIRSLREKERIHDTIGHTTCPDISELKLLRDYQQSLVKALTAMSEDEIVKTWNELQKCGVITMSSVDILSSLDLDRLEFKTMVRYLLLIIYERIKDSKTTCNTFLSVLEGVKEVDVVIVCRVVAHKLVSMTIEGSQKVTGVSERILLTEDVEYVWEILLEYSDRWEEISRLLGLPKHVIAQCGKASSNNNRLHDALTEWICGDHKTAKLPTLSHLKQAMSSPTLEHLKLSLKLDFLKSVKIIPEEDSPLQAMNENDYLVLYEESIDTDVGDGMSTLLEVLVNHSELADYAWVKDSITLSDNFHFSGTHSAVLVIKESSQETQGEYWCKIKHGSKQLTSSPARVKVIYPADKQCLLNYYAPLEEIPKDTWPLHNAREYVDLTLIATGNIKYDQSDYVKGVEIERMLEGKKKVDYDEIFHDYQNTLVLVEGRAGSGKTTLARKITKDWVKGKIFRKVSKLFNVSLRRSYDRVTLFEEFFKSKTQQYLSQIEKSQGEGVCFVFDSYDEYSQKDKDDTIINEIINKKYLPLSMVIVTCRPVATTSLRLEANCIVEIVGFTKEQFDEFVRKYPFQDIARAEEREIEAELKSHLKACTNVLNMCYLPLNAKIICFLYGQLHEKMPKNESKVYDHFVRAILLKTLRKSDPNIKLATIKELPEETKKEFDSLCSLAFDLTVNCKQVFSEVPDGLKCSPVFSLLTEDHIATLTGLEKVYSFLHLTLQEYLAAYHLAHLHEEEQTEMIRLHSGKDHMLTAFKFYCGLVDFIHKMHQFEIITKNRPNTLYALHCAYETNSKAMCKKAIAILCNKIYLGVGVLTPADFSILGKVLSCDPRQIKSVDINSGLLYEEYNSAEWVNRKFDQTDMLSYNFRSTGALTNLRVWEDECCASISYNIISRSTYTKISEILDTINDIQRYNMANQILLCSSDILGSENAEPFIDVLKKCKNVEVFRYIGNCKSEESARNAVKIFENFLNLERIQILGCFYPTGGSILANGLRNCEFLQEIDFKSVDLGTAGCAALACALKSIESLILVKCNITPEGAKIISVAVSSQRFTFLNLSMNNIRSTGLKFLSQSFCIGQFTDRLKLIENNIDVHGIEALASKLTNCHSLYQLDLSCNYLGWEGAAALARGLKFCYKLAYLSLHKCNLTGCGLVLLAEEFKAFIELNYLDLSNNGSISEAQSVEFSLGLNKLDHLQELYLSDNGIDDGVAMRLSGIQMSPHLHTLDLSNNFISDNGIAAIAGWLTDKDMRSVDFSWNKIQAVSVSTFIKLIKSGHIRKLDLSHNNIGSKGATEFIAEPITCEDPIKINLLSNNISSEVIEDLKDFLKNKSLQLLL